MNKKVKVYDTARFKEADFIKAMKWIAVDGTDDSVPVPRIAFNRMCDLSIKHLIECSDESEGNK